MGTLALLLGVAQLHCSSLVRFTSFVLAIQAIALAVLVPGAEWQDKWREGYLLLFDKVFRSLSILRKCKSSRRGLELTELAMQLLEFCDEDWLNTQRKLRGVIL
jgi:hypothetical protein